MTAQIIFYADKEAFQFIYEDSENLFKSINVTEISQTRLSQSLEKPSSEVKLSLGGAWNSTNDIIIHYFLADAFNIITQTLLENDVPFLVDFKRGENSPATHHESWDPPANQIHAACEGYLDYDLIPLKGWRNLPPAV